MSRSLTGAHDEIPGVSIAPVGECALTILFENRIAPEVNDRVLAAAAAIERAALPCVTELVPSYRALMVCYDPMQTGYDAMKATLLSLVAKCDTDDAPERRIMEIPVCYGGEFGPDIENVAGAHGLSPEQVIKLHTAPDYRVYLIGFLAGFPYLGGLDPLLETPRLKKPRISIEAGSVGIAGLQTGVYPVASPGGWQIIGRTPTALYDPAAEQPALLRAGDIVRFRPITETEYKKLKGGA